MKKMSRIIVFFVIGILCIGGMLYKGNFDVGNNIYVVSESETNSKETLQKSNKENTNDIEKNISKSNNQNDRIGKNKITIYISGEVSCPGVVTIESDKRLSDAVEILGGPTKEADLNGINLAMKLKDEEHYIIPKVGENTEPINNESNNESKTTNSDKQNGKININSASSGELDTLPGVGEATANKIIDYRENKKTFDTIEEIKNVNGIGDKKYQELKELICVN